MARIVDERVRPPQVVATDRRDELQTHQDRYRATTVRQSEWPTFKGRVVLASSLPAAGKQRLASQNCGNTTVRCVLADLAGDAVYVYVRCFRVNVFIQTM